MNIEELTIEKLEELRNQLQAQIEEKKAQFVAAGKVLDLKRQLAEGLDLNTGLAAAEKEVVRLQRLRAKAVELGLEQETED
jgi:hypothetical protein